MRNNVGLLFFNVACVQKPAELSELRSGDSLCFRGRINRPFHSIHVYCVRNRRYLIKFSIMEQGRELCRIFEHLTNRSEVECRATEQMRLDSPKTKFTIKKKHFFPLTQHSLYPLCLLLRSYFNSLFSLTFALTYKSLVFPRSSCH